MCRLSTFMLIIPLLVVTAMPAVGRSPTTTEELLSGMVTEEVEPGVFRVISDGVRDLASVEAADIVAGYDGGIWLLQEDGFLRLGSDGSHAWPMGPGLEDHVFEVAPDGTLWVIPSRKRGPEDGYPDVRDGLGLRSDDGERWTVQSCPGRCRGLAVAPDGTVWASWEEDGDWVVGHLGPSGWRPLDGEGRGAFQSDDGGGEGRLFNGYNHLFPTDGGDLYGAECYAGCSLFHHGDGDWEDFSIGALFDVGRDGTVWQEGRLLEVDPTPLWESPGAGLTGLARFADGEWTAWTPDDLPAIRLGLGLDYEFEAAPDGSLWLSLWQSVDGTDPGHGQDWWSLWDRRSAVEDGRLLCDGLGHFDGETLERFLPGQCISMDIAADGSAWVLADDDLYVITPEAAQ